MSIAIVAITERAGVVATDSKTTGGTQSEIAPKIYCYDSKTVFFGIGNYGVLSMFFRQLGILKKHSDKITNHDQIKILETYHNKISNAPLLSGLPTIIGVLSFVKNTTFGAYIDTSEDDSLPYIIHPGEVALFPPPDISIPRSREIFNTKCPQDLKHIPVIDLIPPVSYTINQASLESSYVNNRIQYYGYDHLLQKAVSQNLELRV